MVSTSTFTVIYYQFSTAPTPTPAPIVEISGKIEDNQLILMHRGGEPLDLDTELVLNFGGESKIYTVGDLLDNKSKEDGVWSLSEEVVYMLDYSFDYSEYPNIDIKILDGTSNSLLMTGLTKVNPTCDIGLTIKVNNLNPKEGETIEFILTVTNYGNINASDLSIEFIIPDGLKFISSIAEKGVYNNHTGIWKISQLLLGESIKLFVLATIEKIVYETPTQLVMLLDGSESISSASWDLMLKGLSMAIKDNNIFPHSGCIELSVIQFGGKTPAFAQLEIGPIVITKENVDDIIKKIQNIIQIGEKTPTSCSVYLAADTLKNASMFAPGTSQIVLLVTDGNPTHSCACDGDYVDNSDMTAGPKDSVIDARDYLVELLYLNEYDDEFNALSIEISATGHTSELRDNVVWPQPGYETDDFSERYSPRRGWVKKVHGWEDFAYSINASFKILFKDIIINTQIYSTSFSDPKEVNDLSYILLEPTLNIASAIEK
jgi:uncharacterized repeat protein (TIGR01451 family)